MKTLKLVNGVYKQVELEFAWIVNAVVTANYTASINELVRCDPTGGVFTVTLPTAVGVEGKTIILKNIASLVNVVTVKAFGTETMDNLGTLNVTNILRLTSDGSNWIIW